MKVSESSQPTDLSYPFDQERYEFKESVINVQRSLFKINLVLDAAMLTQASLSVYMMVHAEVPQCQSTKTYTIVSTIAVCIVIRVSHLVFITLFCLCCFPCYFCRDSCCLKKWLINTKGLAK